MKNKPQNGSRILARILRKVATQPEDVLMRDAANEIEAANELIDRLTEQRDRTLKLINRKLAGFEFKSEEDAWRDDLAILRAEIQREVV